MANGKKRILVVDDSQFLVTVLSNTLRQAGYLVDDASEVKEALLSLRSKGPPDLLIMDLNLPDLRGDEAVAALRKVPACSKLPVIFISGLSDQVLAEVTRKVGANGYLKKPFSPSSILRWIRENSHLLDLMDQYRQLPGSSIPPRPPASAPTPPSPEAVGFEPGVAPPAAPTPPKPQLPGITQSTEIAMPNPSPAPAAATAALSMAEDLLAPDFETEFLIDRIPPGTYYEGDLVDQCLLVVDDSSFLRSVLRETLSSVKVPVLLTENIAHATSLLKGVKPRAILLDVNLPDMAGDEACVILKNMPEFQATPIFLTTSSSEEHLQVKAETSGADGYLRKPFTPVHVLEWLRANHLAPEGAQLPGQAAAPPPQESASDLLSQQLQNPDPALRAQAAYSLGEMKNQAQSGVLRGMLADPVPDVVADVLWSLGELRDQAAVAGIQNLLQTQSEAGQSPMVRLRAIEALGKIGDSNAGKTITLCLGADRPQDERVVALQALGDLGEALTLEAVRALVEDPDLEVKTAARQAYSKISGEDLPQSPATPELFVSKPPGSPTKGGSDSADSEFGDDLDQFLSGGLDAF